MHPRRQAKIQPTRAELLSICESFIPTDIDLEDEFDPEDIYFLFFLEQYNTLYDSEGSAYGERAAVKSMLMSLILSKQAPILPWYVPGKA